MVVFSDENANRLIQNLSILSKQIIMPSEIDKPMDKKFRTWLYQNLTNAMEMICMYDNRFSDQFVNTCKIRRVCPNGNCHSRYAFFYDDFYYCPRCGTLLRTTRDDREEDQHAD